MYNIQIQDVVVQLLSHVRLFVTPWTSACQTPLSSTLSQNLLKFMSTESVIPSNHLSLPHTSPPALNLFQHQGLFQGVDSFIMCPKYSSFSFSISPSNEYSGLISFRVDWFDLLAVQGTLKSFLQQHNSKASVLQAQPSLWSNSHIYT